LWRGGWCKLGCSADWCPDFKKKKKKKKKKKIRLRQCVGLLR
jgi:hypothetical protein